VKNGRTGDQELLVARSDQGSEEICGGMRHLPAEQKPHRTAGRKTDAKFNPRKTLGAYIGRLYHQVASSAERVQKGIAHWDKQNHAVPAPNCMLKVRGEIIKDKGL